MNPNFKYALLGLLGSSGGLLTTYAGVWAYKRRAQVDVDSRKQSAAIEAQVSPIQLYQGEVATIRAELAEERKQCRDERAASLKTLIAMQAALEAIAKDLSAHRDEERTRAGSLHDRLDGMDDRLLVIETQLGTRKVA